LAVDANKWRAGEPGAGDLGGDGRYWPASAWFVFCYGTRALEREALLCTEYRTNLDAHSLGLTALRVLVELLPAEGGPSVVARAMLRLRAAWQQYWRDAQQFWQPIFDAFRGAGDFNTVRASFIRARVHETVMDDLCALRSALCEVQQACSGLPLESGLAGMPALCEALLLMVQGGRAERPAAVPAPELEVPACRLARSPDSKARVRQPSESTASPSSAPSSLASSGSFNLGEAV